MFQHKMNACQRCVFLMEEFTTIWLKQHYSRTNRGNSSTELLSKLKHKCGNIEGFLWDVLRKTDKNWRLTQYALFI